MNKEIKMQLGDMFVYKYDDESWYCCLVAAKNVWSQFPMAAMTDMIYLFTKKFDAQPLMPELMDLLSSDIIAFRTILPKRKPKQYMYIGEYAIPKLDIGLKGEGIFIPDYDISKFKNNHTIINCMDGQNIAVPYFDMQGKKMNHIPMLKVGNTIFHCTKGVNEIIEMYNNGVLDIV